MAQNAENAEGRSPLTRSYTCSDCGQTFDTARPDEEAQQEAVANFGKRGDAPGMAIVCDDCYREIMSVVTNDGRKVCDSQVTIMTFMKADIDGLEGQVSELEREIAKRLIEELERETLRLLMTGSVPTDQVGRPLFGVSPLQQDTRPGRFGFIRTDLN
jgi:DNA-directed RNA polymerase subunit RPC12/RpoP